MRIALGFDAPGRDVGFLEAVQAEVANGARRIYIRNVSMSVPVECQDGSPSTDSLALYLLGEKAIMDKTVWTVPCASCSCGLGLLVVGELPLHR